MAAGWTAVEGLSLKVSVFIGAHSAALQGRSLAQRSALAWPGVSDPPWLLRYGPVVQRNAQWGMIVHEYSNHHEPMRKERLCFEPDDAVGKGVLSGTVYQQRHERVNFTELTISHLSLW